MKKELLLASALVGTVGLAGVAEAASATMSGKTRVGVVWADTDAAGDASMNGHQQSSFSVSLSETTDGGIGISTGFDLTDENDAATDNSGLTFTFTSGAKLDLIEAGSAFASHLAAVPSASGEQGVGGSTGFNAPSGLDYADANDTVGFELHSAADAFGVDGLKASVSASFNGDAAATTSVHALENTFSVGASYVSTAGDSTVTIGGGFYQGDTVATAAASDAQSTAMSISAVTGNLTVGAGYASGNSFAGVAAVTADADMEVASQSVTTAGAKYVSGDMTFNVGYASGEGQDEALGTAADGEADTYEQTAASVDYTVASGVTATIGYSDIARSNEATANTDHGGTSWYIGANVSF
jgi:hypothetical protein